VGAFVEQVQVNITERWQEAIGVTAFDHGGVGETEAKPVTKWQMSPGEKNPKHALPKAHHEPFGFVD
jgi:hypothetical protein